METRFLPLGEKLNILNQYKNGEILSDVAAKYKVNKSTISRIKKKEKIKS